MTAATHRWLAIVGIGEDGIDGLSEAARRALTQAGAVFGGQRHLALTALLLRGEVHPWPSPITEAVPRILARGGEPTAVLASGDPFWFGIGTTLARVVSASEYVCYPSVSAFSLACARLGWSLQDVGTVSLCGRDPALLLPMLQPDARLLILSGDGTTPRHVGALARQHGFGDSEMTVLGAMGGSRETLRTVSAYKLDAEEFDPLNVIALTVRAAPDARVIPLSCGLPEAIFDHDGQITKREIRAATLARLAPRQGELLWDIGCGSGSIAIEWMLRHPSNRAIGIEARPDRAARARGNARALGVPGLDVRIAEAPEALLGLPAPDAVFIGGGGGRQAASIIEAVWAALKQGGRLVMNAVTLETEASAIAAWQRWGGELVRLSIERLEPIGDLHGFRPTMTVTQWAAVKPH